MKIVFTKKEAIEALRKEHHLTIEDIVDIEGIQQYPINLPYKPEYPNFINPPYVVTCQNNSL